MYSTVIGIAGGSGSGKTTVAEKVYAEETLTQFQDKQDPELIYKEATLNGTLNVVYNENDGFYHVDSNDGYLLLAKISEPCPYMDRAFSKVNKETLENEGILSVTGIVVDNGKKDYSEFVQEYEKYCNSDGVYPVTQELKTFLELLIKKEFYFDERRGNWIGGQLDYIAIKELQWLFPACYYAN